MSQQIMEFVNPLGFTNETEELVKGLGCTNLKQFKKKDINIDDLQYLTNEDLQVLEVGDSFKYESLEQLKNSLKRKYDNKGVKGPGIDDVIKILKSAKRQLLLVNFYMGYLKIKLEKNREDLFIDKDKNKKASEVMMEACDNLLSELKEFTANLSSLEKLKRYEKAHESSPYAEALKCFLVVACSIGAVGAGVLTVVKYKYL